jgi:Cd2+/Zn2+-exporting ATPase
MRKQLWRIIASGLIFAGAIILGFYNGQLVNKFWVPALFISSYIIVGGDIVLKAVKNIFKGQVFDENFLMSIATIGAILIQEYPEAVAVMLFYQIGELFQSHAVNKSRKSIAELMDIRPDYANLKKGEELFKVEPDEVKVGDQIVVKVGEKIPLDGTIIEGSSTLDTSALTGEFIPRQVEIGSQILSGCVNLSGVITIQVTKGFEESTVNKILDLVENASSKKSKSERFITRFARYYTPVVVFIAIALALIPPMLINGASFSVWLYRALTFLVVSCPCALVVSIPLSFFSGIGGASRQGILVKGSNYLEALAQTEVVVFDKTGTLTKGVFNVQKIHSVGISEGELLELVAHAEAYSNHPISQSLQKAYTGTIDNRRVAEVKELPGLGVVASVDNKKVAVGNAKLMAEMNIPYSLDQTLGAVVHVAIDQNYAGYILISDELKTDVIETIQKLKAAKIKRTVMLTGDEQRVAAKISEQLGLDGYYAELLPAEKVQKLEELYTLKSSNKKLAYVGDGINDAPVLARADIGIAMGGLGSDAAIEAADIVIMNDEPAKILTAIKIAQKTLRIAWENTYFAIGVKVAVLCLSAVGLASMWAAVFADVGVTMLAILNSFRALNVQNL